MWAFILLKLKSFGGWFAAGLLFLFMLLAAWISARKVGTAEAQAKASDDRALEREAIATRIVNEERASNTKQTEVIKGALNVKKENSVVDDDVISKRLREEWSRD